LAYAKLHQHCYRIMGNVVAEEAPRGLVPVLPEQLNLFRALSGVSRSGFTLHVTMICVLYLQNTGKKTSLLRIQIPVYVTQNFIEFYEIKHQSWLT